MVGTVSLEDTEFSEKLEFLRQTAAALGPGGVTTKLVIPNSQILFTTAEAPGPSDAERTNQIRGALDGLTPYDISDLVYDWTDIDGTVVVAAVARETLDEAESFASEHGFNPVSFVATPQEGVFTGAEPFFGTSQSAVALLGEAESIERDGQAIHVVGTVPLPDDSLTTAADADAEIPPPTPSAEITPEPEQPHEFEPTGASEPRPQAESEPEPEPQTPPEEIIAPDPPIDMPTAPEPDVTSEPLSVAGVTAAELPDLEGDPAEAVTPAFASRRAGQSSESGDQALKRIEKIESRLAILPEGMASLAPKLGGVSRAVIKETPEPTAPAKVQKAKPPAPTPPPTPSPKKPQTVAAPIQPTAPATPLIDLSETQTPPAYPAVKTEEQAMTVFGARKKPAQPGKPRYLGLSLMVLLLAVLGAIVLWSTFFLSEETAFWRGGQTDTLDRVQTPSNGANPVNDALALLTEPSIRRVGQPEEITPPDPLVLADPIAIPAPTSAADPLATPAASPAPAMTPEVAQAAYLDSGIWQLAPKPPIDLRQDSIDTLYITSVDPQITSLDAIALPTSPEIYADTSLELQSSPAAHNTAFVLDERGLVIPTIDGTMTPNGVMVFAGPPPILPKARGNRVPQVTIEPDLRLAKFKPRPRPANLVAQTEAVKETESLGGYTRVQLAALRPKPRPYVVSPPQHIDETAPEDPVAQTPQETVETPQGPTSELAVVLSSLPKHRPRNFAKVVDRARASAPAERATATTAVPRNQTVAPSAPTRASVARLATTKNAINLRRTSLIGVYGSPSKRRALVRLSNGRYVKVKVGQRVDGGKVAAIGQSELRYVKGGRTIVLRMPKS